MKIRFPNVKTQFPEYAKDRGLFTRKCRVSLENFTANRYDLISSVESRSDGRRWSNSKEEKKTVGRLQCLRPVATMAAALNLAGASRERVSGHPRPKEKHQKKTGNDANSSRALGQSIPAPKRRAARWSGRPTFNSRWRCEKRLLAQLKTHLGTQEHAKAVRIAYSG
jgi:hypothetical protein